MRFRRTPDGSPGSPVTGWQGEKGGKSGTGGNDGKRLSAEAAKRRLIDSLYADDPGRAPDWLDSRLLSTGQVALLFQVTRRSVSAWARNGRLPYLSTPGGHRRFRIGDVRALLDAASGQSAAPSRRSRRSIEHN